MSKNPPKEGEKRFDDTKRMRQAPGSGVAGSQRDDDDKRLEGVVKRLLETPPQPKKKPKPESPKKAERPKERSPRDG